MNRVYLDADAVVAGLDALVVGSTQVPGVSGRDAGAWP